MKKVLKNGEVQVSVKFPGWMVHAFRKIAQKDERQLSQVCSRSAVIGMEILLKDPDKAFFFMKNHDFSNEIEEGSNTKKQTIGIRLPIELFKISKDSASKEERSLSNFLIRVIRVGLIHYPEHFKT